MVLEAVVVVGVNEVVLVVVVKVGAVDGEVEVAEGPDVVFEGVVFVVSGFGTVLIESEGEGGGGKEKCWNVLRLTQTHTQCSCSHCIASHFLQHYHTWWGLLMLWSCSDAGYAGAFLKNWEFFCEEVVRKSYYRNLFYGQYTILNATRNE